MKAKDLDKKFDSGEDITEFLDMKNASVMSIIESRIKTS